MAEALPADIAQEVVLTGSVSRAAADELSDIEMLVVTHAELSLAECFALARAAGLEGLDTWGIPLEPVRRVSGLLEGVSVETVWWPREYALRRIDDLLTGDAPATADALVHGVALRTEGLLESWQARLARYPAALAATLIEEAALPWGGFPARGLLTLTRAGDRLALSEWIVDCATRVLAVVFATNRVWQPTTKRLASRIETLPVKPDRLAERIDDALTEAEPRRALLTITELQLDALAAAPSGPCVDRARAWLAEGLEILRAPPG